MIMKLQNMSKHVQFTKNCKKYIETSKMLKMSQNIKNIQKTLNMSKNS